MTENSFTNSAVEVDSTLGDVHRLIDSLWPEAAAEDWDRVGLVSGNPAHHVRRVLLAVDAVRATVDEAIGRDADLLLVHHPLLLRGVTSVGENEYKGALLADLIRGGCALIAAHTNADRPADGVSARIADLLGLVDSVPIDPGADPCGGIGRIGRLPEIQTLGDFARRVARIMPATASGIRVSGDYHRAVSTVALCGGAGDSLLSSPVVRAADVYLTSDLRHHPASESREQALCGGGPALIDVSHWASEWLWLDVAAETLRARLPHIEFVVSDTRTDVWDFTIVQ
ncbi:Nif3-like dinuclear metal center hexameric protein [Klugiella xanthotipulae]|uniref:GTP cyclohydrolase 1 type 2 homolog n=1 Tax=Klugiella xanthotipulae TaxID=244735 RepID=A0A543HSA8_9MICO|nr:Nif3-like dinuclear metal center hexameric protein [Klugiella xanthotipulae]TQM61149.1 dinuclear metal center YbgI/SA1388 family protein [Klugiella xanthotipulae]